MGRREAEQHALDELMELVDRCAPVSAIEIAYLRYVLACFDGNKARAAQQIKIDRRTIQRWLGRKRR